MVPTAAARATRAARPARANGDQAKEARRAAILAAAKGVFAGTGYHSATVADVARAAGISYGSVYWYFDSKEALFHALMDDQEQALRRHIEAALTGAGADLDGEAAFRSGVRATLEFFEADRDAATLLFRDSLALDRGFEAHLGGLYEGFIDDIEAVVTAAQVAGQVIDAPPRLVAASVAALVGQLALRRLATDDGVGADVVAELVVTMVLDGLRPRPDGDAR